MSAGRHVPSRVEKYSIWGQMHRHISISSSSSNTVESTTTAITHYFSLDYNSFKRFARTQNPSPHLHHHGLQIAPLHYVLDQNQPRTIISFASKRQKHDQRCTSTTLFPHRSSSHVVPVHPSGPRKYYTTSCRCSRPRCLQRLGRLDLTTCTTSARQSPQILAYHE